MDQKRRLRIICSVIGLACIVASIAMIFLAPGELAPVSWTPRI